MHRLHFIALFALAVPILCRAEESCPWLNAGTAAGILDGPVALTVTHPNNDKDAASCNFVRQKDSLTFNLFIEVETMRSPKTQCGVNATPVHAIGNEAFACSLGKQGQLSEQIVGRVRDRAFLIRLTTNDPSAAQSSYRDKVRKVAEQVAGALF